MEARRPDLVVVDKKERSCKIIDIAVPGDSRIEEKEKDETEKISRLGKGVTKEMKCSSEDQTISCRLLRCYIQTIWLYIETDWYYSRNSTSSEDPFTWNG